MPSDSNSFRSLKQNIAASISSVYIQNLDIIHKVGFFLFPPTNQLKMFNANEIKDVKRHCAQHIMCLLAGQCKTPGSDAAASETDDSDSVASDFEREMFAGIVNDCTNLTTERIIDCEIERYHNVIVDFHAKFDVLMWWHEHRYLFKNLYKLSNAVLCIPATCSAAERAMLKASSLIADKCNPATVNNQVFLNSAFELDLSW